MVVSISQLDEVDHIMLTLARKFQELTKIGKEFEKVDLEELSQSSTDEAIQIMAQNPRILLAQKMLKRYSKGKMPLMDDIIAAKMGAVSTSSDRLKFSLGKSDNITPHTSELQNPESTPENNNNGDDSKGWPPRLPEIRNPKLRRQVFTHSSAVQMPEHLTKAEILDRHNERLEFKGDSVLDYIVCGMLYKAFPHADEGLLTMRKAELVCNATLWDLCMVYNLHSKLRTQVIVKDTPDTPQDKRSKVIADLFEAYVGGLAIDRGLEEVQAWLEQLYAPFMMKFTQKNDRKKGEDEVDRMAKTELYQKVGSQSQIPEYLTDDVEPPFTVRCVVNGEVIGTGVDHNTKKAGLRAAKNALENKEIIERLASLRRAEPRTAPVTTDGDVAKPGKAVNSSANESPKQALYVALGGVKERAPTYRVVPTAKPVTVQCICQGEVLSEAWAQGKAEAINLAAKQALENKSLVFQLSKRRG